MSPQGGNGMALAQFFGVPIRVVDALVGETAI
jgi:bifunctional DNase/RNase